MTTSLDKQAREFWDGWLNIWLQEHPAILPNSVVAISFAAAFATQVREQSIAECAEIIRAYDHAATLLTDQQLLANQPLMDAILKGRVLFPAPPETTEQERG